VFLISINFEELRQIRFLDPYLTSSAKQEIYIMVQISEVKGNARDSRTAAHTHIKGLGLRTDGTAERQAAGFVGQSAAREVCNNYSFLI